MALKDVLAWWNFSNIGSNVWRLGHYHSSLLRIRCRIKARIRCRIHYSWSFFHTEIGLEWHRHEANQVQCEAETVIMKIVRSESSKFTIFLISIKLIRALVSLNAFCCALMVRSSKIRFQKSLKRANSWQERLQIQQPNSKLL